MQTMEALLREEVKQLKKIEAEAGKRLKTAPKGHLRIMKKGNSVEYYYKNSDEGGSSNGRYMRKSEFALAKAIAQKDYDVQVVKYAKERIKAIDIFLRKYKETSLKALFYKTNQYRRALVTAQVISDEEYIRKWQMIEYKGKTFAEDAQEIITERGERVRSKSEKIIADKLYALGIPYRYEYPLVLDGDMKMYPDFTILKMPEREEVYLEHFGLMDDSNYVDTVMYKLSTYQKNEIYLGVHLFVTFETGKNPLNTRALDKQLRKLFLPE